MSLNAEVLKGLIEAQLVAAGFDITNEHAKTIQLVAAISTAVVAHITTDAALNIPAGKIV